MVRSRVQPPSAEQAWIYTLGSPDNGLRAALQTAADLGQAATFAAVTPTGGWVLLSARGIGSHDVPDGLVSELEAARRSGAEVKALAFTPDGQGWLLVTGEEVAASDGIPAAVVARVRALEVGAGFVTAVAFDPLRWNGEGEGTGYVVVGHVGFGGLRAAGTPGVVYHARGVEQVLCDALDGFGAAGTCAEAAGAPFAMRPDRNKLIVLIHGITPETWEAPKVRVGTSDQPRTYWGRDFVRALMGLSEGQDGQLAYADAAGQWQGIPFRPAVWTDCTDGGRTEQATMNCYGNAQRAGYGGARRPPLIVDDLAGLRDPSASFTAVLATFREGAKDYATQLAAAIDQIYDSYQRDFGAMPVGQQPQIYLVTHSFGGIVARGILSAPTGDLSVVPGHGQLTAEQVRRAEWIRDRTVLTVTMSTPHEGTPLGPLSQDLGNNLRMWQEYVFFGQAAWLEDARHAISGDRPVFYDIRNHEHLNQTSLEPSRAHRSDGSLVPIYTLSGRNPGGYFFAATKGIGETLQMGISTLDVLGAGNRGFEAGMQLLIEVMLRVHGYGLDGMRTGDDCHPFGAVEPGMEIGDHVGLVPGFCTNVVLAAQPLALALALNPQTLGYGFEPDGGYDSDGLVGFSSGHGLHLGTGTMNHFGNERTYTVAGRSQSGSWYRLYEPAYGRFFPWDWDNHGSLMFNVGNGLFLYNNVISQAGPLTSPGMRSVWPGETAPTSRPSRRLGVHINRIESYDNLDEERAADCFGQCGESDLTVVVQIGPYDDAHVRRFQFPDDVDDFKNDGQQGRTMILNEAVTVTSDVVPIRITAFDRDGGSLDRNDFVTLSQFEGRESVFVYYDFRTQRISGDVAGEEGVEIPVTGHVDAPNRGRVVFTVYEE